MKLSLISLCAALAGVEAQNNVAVQTFYVPLPDQALLQETFVQINDGSVERVPGAEGPVVSIVSIGVGFDMTVITYDHWEDGFENDALSPAEATTEIWGDGDCSNGFAPNIRGEPVDCNNPEDDTLSSGDAILLQNEINVTPGRDADVVLYDGGDKIQTSFPIAITRAAYPKIPGSLMAGAVEVWDLSSWGSEFVAPIGVDTISDSEDAFEYSALYVMACKDGTEVTLNGESRGIIDQGQNIILDSVSEGDVVQTSEIAQVHLLAGDILSSYELRWYSLLPLSLWSTDYYTPVGGVETTGPVGKFTVDDNERQTKVWLFNPNEAPIDVSFTVRMENGLVTDTITVPGGASADSPILPLDSGGRYFTEDGSKFFALTQTNTESNQHVFDWGHPLVPADLLTPQVLVGWGYGCESNDCLQDLERSPFEGSRTVVWVTPIEDAIIHVDFDGDGLVDTSIQAQALESVRIFDEDNDMTGALIFADSDAGEVNFAAAWGQDPSKSTLFDPSAMDLGTLIPPLRTVDAGISCNIVGDLNNDGKLNPGETVRYTIRLVNSGISSFTKGSLLITNFDSPLLDEAAYVPGSATYIAFNPDGSVAFEADIDPDSTDFPFNEGIKNMAELRKGGAHEISFSVQLDSLQFITEGMASLVNTGAIATVLSPDAILVTFQDEKPIDFPDTTTTTTTTSTTTTTTTSTTTTTTEEPTTTTTSTTTTTEEPTTTTTSTTSTTTTTEEPTTTTTSTTTTTEEPTTTTTSTTSTTTTTEEPTTTTTSTTTTTEEPTTTTTACPLVPVVDEHCIDLWAEGMVSIGKVCPRVVADSLEIDLEITRNDCCLTESHICNLPTEEFRVSSCQRELSMMPIPIDTVYDFVCAFDEDEFIVAGHATAVCGSLERKAYYEVPITCACI